MLLMTYSDSDLFEILKANDSLGAYGSSDDGYEIVFSIEGLPQFSWWFHAYSETGSLELSRTITIGSTTWKDFGTKIIEYGYWTESQWNNDWEVSEM